VSNAVSIRLRTTNPLLADTVALGGPTKRSQLPRIKESKVHSASGVAFVVFRQVELDSLVGRRPRGRMVVAGRVAWAQPGMTERRR
jgi:hypothetical protein